MFPEQPAGSLCNVCVLCANKPPWSRLAAVEIISAVPFAIALASSQVPYTPTTLRFTSTALHRLWTTTLAAEVRKSDACPIRRRLYDPVGISLPAAEALLPTPVRLNVGKGGVNAVVGCQLRVQVDRGTRMNLSPPRCSGEAPSPQRKKQPTLFKSWNPAIRISASLRGTMKNTTWDAVTDQAWRLENLIVYAVTYTRSSVSSCGIYVLKTSVRGAW